MDKFTTQYLLTALWSSTDNSTESGGVPLDRNYNISHFSKPAITKAIGECEVFQQQQAELLENAGDDAQNGHDFWLTRNRHGAGFWDRGYDEDTAQALTAAAHAHGEVQVYTNDDGELEIT